MKPLLALILLGTAIWTARAAEDSDAALKTQLMQQATAWDMAICRKDADAVTANVGEDFRHIDANGDVSDRPTFLAELLSSDLTIDPYTVDDLDVRLYGEIALLSGTTRMTGTYQGKPFKSHYRYLDIYHRQHGRWVVVHIQITRLRE